MYVCMYLFMYVYVFMFGSVNRALAKLSVKTLTNYLLNESYIDLGSALKIEEKENMWRTE